MTDSFAARDTLEVQGRKYAIASLAKLGQKFDITRHRSLSYAPTSQAMTASCSS